ncbi:MAG: hypothetical protein QOD73_3387 [Solirubrobacteraceae bacterium]|jgi:hypothetical protein|nr:hypothetical protein [Solirubrobacteraceae bacterium]
MVPPEDSGDPRRRFGRRTARGSGGARPTWPGPRGTPVNGRILTVEDRCWQCRSKVRAIVGVTVDPHLTTDRDGFLPFDAVGEQLAAALDRRALASRRIGELKHRESPGVPGGYLSNGCIECDALIGRFHLEDLLHEHLMGGGTHAQLDIGVPVELPLGVPARLTALG